MARTVKKLLGNTETEIFRNWDDRPNSKIIAQNITLCNTSGSVVQVHLGFVVLSGLFLAGAVLSNTDLAAYETRTIEITPRVMNVDESIRAYCSVPNVVSLSVDLIGDIEQEPEIIP